MQSSDKQHREGLLSAVLAYALWGSFPLFWLLLNHIGAFEILMHRMTWSMFFVVALVSALRGWSWLPPLLKQPKVLLLSLVTAILIALNWGIYIYAVLNAHIVETSLGYYINPLISVILGVVFFKERLRTAQWVALAIASIGVIQMLLVYGRLPWIALSLAVSFAAYGALKKLIALGSLEGMAIETAILFIPAAGLLIYWQLTGAGSFGQIDTPTDILLLIGGIISMVPLLLFASAAGKIPLSTLGMIQYMAPSIALLTAIFVMDETFEQGHLIGFAIIWFALLIFSVDGFKHRRIS